MDAGNGAADLVRKLAREGDVINLDPVKPPLWIAIGAWGIRLAQKKLFGTASNWHDDHSMIYFTSASVQAFLQRHKEVEKLKTLELDGSRHIFSVQPPLATFVSPESFATDKISIYRYNANKERPTGLTAEDTGMMLETTLRLLAEPYDFGQLLTIAVNEILGYPFERKTSIFDFGKRLKVCSVGVAAVYQSWRHKLREGNETSGSNGPIPPRLFRSLRSGKWSQEMEKRFRADGSRWDVENVYPAHFANTDYFADEFTLVARIENGRIVP